MLSQTRAIQKIEEIYSEDAGNRGIGNISLQGQLDNALSDLLASKRVMILTGFVIKAAGIGETDGPLGALSMAKALETMGKQVILVTDHFSHGLLEKGKEILGIQAEVANVPYENAAAFCLALLDKFAPDHFVAIERPGKAANGDFHSMRGEKLTPLIPDTDILMIAAAERDIRTTAIGDGGNELGMGKVREKIMTHVNLGEEIAAVVAADNLLLAGVSNWGGHGIAAGLSVLTGRNLLHDEEMEKKVLDAIVEAGSVDGCTRERVATVDGLSLEKNLGIVRQYQEIIQEFTGERL